MQNRQKILIISDFLDASFHGKTSRMIIDDFRRFIDVKCFQLQHSNLQIPDITPYEHLLVKNISEDDYDGIFVMCDLSRLWANEKFTYLYRNLTKPTEHNIDKLNKCKLIVSYSDENIKDVIKNNITYLPSTFMIPFGYTPEDPYYFYTIIGRNDIEDHIAETIISFLYSFTSKDRVSFRVYTNGVNPDQIQKDVQNILSSSCLVIKSDLPNIEFDNNRYNDDQFRHMYSRNHCYVGIDYNGEFNPYLYECAVLGKPIIYNLSPLGKKYWADYFKEGSVNTFEDIGLHITKIAITNNNKEIEWCTSLLEISKTMQYIYIDKIQEINFDWAKYDNTEGIINAVCSTS